MLDPLIDRQNRHIAGVSQPAGGIDPRQVVKHPDVPVAGDEYAIDEVRTG